MMGICISKYFLGVSIELKIYSCVCFVDKYMLFM